MAGSSVKYWKKTNVSNAIPHEGGFVPFEELLATNVGYLASSDKELNDYLESLLGTYGLTLLTKDEYDESKKKTLSSGSKRKWREEIGGTQAAPDSVAPSVQPPAEPKAATVSKKETVFSKAESEGSLPENYKPKSGKRQSK